MIDASAFLILLPSTIFARIANLILKEETSKDASPAQQPIPASNVIKDTLCILTIVRCVLVSWWVAWLVLITQLVHLAIQLWVTNSLKDSVFVIMVLLLLVENAETVHK